MNPEAYWVVPSDNDIYGSDTYREPYSQDTGILGRKIRRGEGPGSVQGAVDLAMARQRAILREKRRQARRLRQVAREIAAAPPRQKSDYHMGDFPDYRGEGFRSSEDVPYPGRMIMSPGRTAEAMARIRGSGDAGYGYLPRGRRGQELRQYAQHAAQMLWNPTLPASERPALMEQLRAAGAPIGTTSDSVARALSFGPGAIGVPGGLYGSRRR